MKYYIGLDAHSSTSMFAVVDENGQCKLREMVDPTRVELVTYPCHGHMIPTSPWAPTLNFQNKT